VNPDRRGALLLHHVGGWSFREIARKLGIRETAAKLRSSRGMSQLRDALREDESRHD
jgi:DNA-directed RNA polymerase specialized sigma24 family protein